jgi:hypothetical protein
MPKLWLFYILLKSIYFIPSCLCVSYLNCLHCWALSVCSGLQSVRNPGGLDWTSFCVRIELSSITLVVTLWEFTGRDSHMTLLKELYECHWLNEYWGADHTGQFYHHPPATAAVIMWKVVGQLLFLNIIPSNFTARTGWKVWCDRGMSVYGLGELIWIKSVTLCRLWFGSVSPGLD